MTVAVAVRKNGRTVLAADSLVNFGGQRFPYENCQFHKIIPLGDSVIVWAGWSLYSELLTAYLAERPPPSLFTEADVFSFFVGFWRAIARDYTLQQRAGRAEHHPFADLESTFLLANRDRIFRVAGDMDVTAFGQYTAVGSGSKYALGALRVLYDQYDDPETIARLAVAVGIDFDVECGGPIDIVLVPPAARRPKLTRRTPKAVARAAPAAQAKPAAGAEVIKRVGRRKNAPPERAND